MDFKTLVTSLVGILNTYIVPTIFALIFFAFVWGAANYFIIHGGEESSREKGRQLLLWGILAIVVLLGLWGIVNILLSTLQIAPV